MNDVTPKPSPTREVAAEELLGYTSAAQLPEVSRVERMVLKRGDAFAVTDLLGNIAPAGARDQGLFFQDTRYLSHYELRIAGGPPVVLSTHSTPEYLSQIDLTVSGAAFGGLLMGESENFLHLRREQLIDGHLLDRITLTNYVTHAVRYWAELSFAADFADMFEVRGARRGRRGTYFAPLVERDLVVLSYCGLDGRLYRTEIRFSGAPARLDARSARFEYELAPNASARTEITVTTGVDGARQRPRPGASFDERAALAQAEYQAYAGGCARIETSDESFNASLSQGLADLKALTVGEGGQRVVAAGIPWYAVPFGRDALITGFEALPVAPDIARDALLFLAAHQGQVEDAFREEEPGKIPHELRAGEMARAGEIPHTPYYGTVDATPLWLVLLSEYHLWTGDEATVRSLLPAAEKALAWMEGNARLHPRGLLTYQRKSPRGLVNQGWKDSHSGVCFPDGLPCEAPIALVEVQGYALDAYRRMAKLYRRLGYAGRATLLAAQAEDLAQAIDECFYLPDRGYYALALAKGDQIATTLTSNAGHLLFSRAISVERAEEVAGRLLEPALFSGYGIRTLAEGQRAFNPLSYHNGTIWPHDNALIAMGLCHYGHTRAAAKVLDGLYEAARHFRHHRLPELFCGMARADHGFPVQYPVACSPQAWASGAFFLLTRAILGLYPDAPQRTLHIRNPYLPPWLSELLIRDMRVGTAKVTLHFSRSGEGCFATVPRLEGGPLRVRIDVGWRP